MSSCLSSSCGIQYKNIRPTALWETDGWLETDSVWFPRDANEDTLVEYRILPPKSYREDGCYLRTV